MRAGEMPDALYVGAGTDPYALLSEGFAAVAARLGTFAVRADKSAPADLHLFGWCTWDVRARRTATPTPTRAPQPMQRARALAAAQAIGRTHSTPRRALA